MTSLIESCDDRFAGIDIESLLSGVRRPLSYERKKALYEAPEFIQRLSGEETVMEGQSICIECKIRGFPVPSLRWFKDDEEILDHPRIHVQTDGIGGYFLVIDHVTRADEAAYRCRAENVEGACSSFFFLSVKGKNKKNKRRAAPSWRTVSFPPMFSTIVELVEEEELQELESSHLPPSPLAEFYFALTLRNRNTWPTFLGDWAFVKDRNSLSDTDTDEDHYYNDEDENIKDEDDDEYTKNQLNFRDDVMADKIKLGNSRKSHLAAKRKLRNNQRDKQRIKKRELDKTNKQDLEKNKKQEHNDTEKEENGVAGIRQDDTKCINRSTKLDKELQNEKKMKELVSCEESMKNAFILPEKTVKTNNKIQIDKLPSRECQDKKEFDHKTEDNVNKKIQINYVEGSAAYIYKADATDYTKEDVSSNQINHKVLGSTINDLIKAEDKRRRMATATANQITGENILHGARDIIKEVETLCHVPEEFKLKEVDRRENKQIVETSAFRPVASSLPSAADTPRALEGRTPMICVADYSTSSGFLPSREIAGDRHHLESVNASLDLSLDTPLSFVRSESSDEALGVFRSASRVESLGAHRSASSIEPLGFNRSASPVDTFGACGSSSTVASSGSRKSISPVESLGIYRSASPVESLGVSGPASPTDSLGVYRSASPTDSLGVYRSASPTDSLGVYRSASPTDSLAVYRSASPTDSLGVYRSASPTASLGVYRSASATDLIGVYRSASPHGTLGAYRSTSVVESLDVHRSPAPVDLLRASRSISPVDSLRYYGSTSPADSLNPYSAQEHSRINRSPSPSESVHGYRPTSPMKSSNIFRTASPENSLFFNEHTSTTLGVNRSVSPTNSTHQERPSTSRDLFSAHRSPSPNSRLGAHTSYSPPDSLGTCRSPSPSDVVSASRLTCQSEESSTDRSPSPNRMRVLDTTNARMHESLNVDYMTPGLSRSNDEYLSATLPRLSRRKTDAHSRTQNIGEAAGRTASDYRRGNHLSSVESKGRYLVQSVDQQRRKSVETACVDRLEQLRQLEVQRMEELRMEEAKRMEELRTEGTIPASRRLLKEQIQKRDVKAREQQQIEDLRRKELRQREELWMKEQQQLEDLKLREQQLKTGLRQRSDYEVFTLSDQIKNSDEFQKQRDELRMKETSQVQDLTRKESEQKEELRIRESSQKEGFKQYEQSIINCQKESSAGGGVCRPAETDTGEFSRQALRKQDREEAVFTKKEKLRKEQLRRQHEENMQKLQRKKELLLLQSLHTVKTDSESFVHNTDTKFNKMGSSVIPNSHHCGSLTTKRAGLLEREYSKLQPRTTLSLQNTHTGISSDQQSEMGQKPMEEQGCIENQNVMRPSASVPDRNRASVNPSKTNFKVDYDGKNKNYEDFDSAEISKLTQPVPEIKNAKSDKCVKPSIQDKAGPSPTIEDSKPCQSGAPHTEISLASDLRSRHYPSFFQVNEPHMSTTSGHTHDDLCRLAESIAARREEFHSFLSQCSLVDSQTPVSDINHNRYHSAEVYRGNADIPQDSFLGNRLLQTDKVYHYSLRDQPEENGRSSARVVRDLPAHMRGGRSEHTSRHQTFRAPVESLSSRSSRTGARRFYPEDPY